MRSLPRVLISALVPGLILPVFLSGSAAVELWSNTRGDRHVFLNAAVKWTSLLSHAPEDTLFYPERWSAATLWRLRLAGGGQPASWLKTEISYEQRARTVSEGAGAAGGAGFLPSEGRAPYRIEPLDEPLVEVGTTFSYRHELDRAFATVRLGRSDITVGRQAIGWGRGMVYGAVDIFSPFTPLESDREWRRGVDALRAGVPLSDLVSLEVVAALGETRKSSSFAARLSGYRGNLDGELIFGKRGEDILYAATTSFPVVGAEVHGELALFNTSASFSPGAFGRDDLVAKSVLGGSYSFDVRGRLFMIIAEHHFSGFGVGEMEDLGARLEAGDFVERFFRGDFQILGRHAAAVQLIYGFGGGAPLTVSWISNPSDGSGVVSPGASWVFSDNVTLVGSAYLPYGAKPEGGALRSEYGGTPVSALLQLSFYY
jgi:hypothetical protein